MDIRIIRISKKKNKDLGGIFNSFIGKLRSIRGISGKTNYKLSWIDLGIRSFR